MDKIHARALEALQPFLALATTSQSPRFIATMIENATAAPHTFVFCELLETAAMQGLRGEDAPAEFRGYVTLLEIFAWGTWEDYQS